MAKDRPFPLHAGVAIVAATTLVSPSMRRFTITAPTFADPGVEQPGEILTLGWPGAGEALTLPMLGWRFPPEAPEQHWRNFSVRSHDTATATIDVEIFLHGDLGQASRWALSAQVGDEVGYAGPRTHWEPDPAAEWNLLIADETGLPALMAIAEALPAGHPAVAVIEVAGADDMQRIESPGDLECHWALRGDAEPGTVPSLLLDTLKGVALPDRPGQAWGGGEALAIRDVRRHLAANCPQVAASLNLLGYWKHRATPDDVD